MTIRKVAGILAIGIALVSLAAGIVIALEARSSGSRSDSAADPGLLYVATMQIVLGVASLIAGILLLKNRASALTPAVLILGGLIEVIFCRSYGLLLVLSGVLGLITLWRRQRPAQPVA